MSKLSVSIAIPAYKNPERLKRCLLSIRNCDREWLADTVVVDDSGDGMVSRALRNEFPMIHWIIHDENRGFAYAANNAVSACRGKWVLLLNDDSELVNDPRSAVRLLLADESVFAISLQSIDERGTAREGAKRVVWRAGIAKVLHSLKDQPPLDHGVSETAYAVGGHALYRKSAFHELGGFDLLFHPFYWEDVDLCRRAKEAGWRILFASESRVLHRADGAIKSTQSNESIRRITWRNRLLFSYRHARGKHRTLFPVGVLWNQLHASVTRDGARLLAISDFKKQTRLK